MELHICSTSPKENQQNKIMMMMMKMKMSVFYVPVSECRSCAVMDGILLFFCSLFPLCLAVRKQTEIVTHPKYTVHSFH